MKFREYKPLKYTTWMIYGGETFVPTEENSTPVILEGGDYDGIRWPKHASWDEPGFMLLRNTRDGESTDLTRMYIYKPTDRTLDGVPIMQFEMFAVGSPSGVSPCDPDFKHINHNEMPDDSLIEYSDLAYNFSKESSNE